MIEYTEYELIELFGCEPKMLCEDEDVGIYSYKHTDEYGFTLGLGISIYEEHCRLTLTYKNFTKPLYQMKFDEIEKIECSENRLIMQQRNKTKSIIVCFKPNYSLTFEERLL